jgi:hypothetical protein
MVGLLARHERTPHRRVCPVVSRAKQGRRLERDHARLWATHALPVAAWRPSAVSSVVGPSARRPASMSACRTHTRSAAGAASRRYRRPTAVYEAKRRRGGCVLCMRTPSLSLLFTQRTGVHSTGGTLFSHAALLAPHHPDPLTSWAQVALW